MGPEETGRDPRTDFIERWAYGTVFAWFLGAASAAILFVGYTELISRLFPFSGEEMSNVLTLIAAPILLAIGGAIVGEAQWRIGLRGRVRESHWLIASAAIPFTFIVGIRFVGDLLPPIYTSSRGADYSVSFEIANTWALGVLGQGILWGLATGLPTYLVLRAYFRPASRWLLGNIIGITIVFIIDVALAAVSGSDMVPRLLSCCVGPLIFGEATGIALFSLLKESKSI